MFATFIITLREGLEAFLIVAISVAYLRQTGRSRLVPAVHWGIAVALGASIVAGLFFRQAENKPLWEGVLALVAALLVASLTIHMRHAAHAMQAPKLQLAMLASRTGPAAFAGVFAFTVFMVGREGMETVLLITALLFQVHSKELLAGGVLGLIVAGGVAWAWARYGHHVNLTRFFQTTTIFLYLLVAQLLIYGFHELTEAQALPLDNDYWHAVTEPYGPEGPYWHWLTYALVALPGGWLLVATLRDRRLLRWQVEEEALAAVMKRKEGRIVMIAGQKTAAYCDESGTIHLFSPVCPHAACDIAWNSEAKTWDCPCHGARFDPIGKLMRGPAMTDLQLKKRLTPPTP
jgi:high-affinity iron transporter